MNTRQAYATYGSWATMAGYASYLRAVLGLEYTPSRAAVLSRKGNERWVHTKPSVDEPFPPEALRAIETRSRMRRKILLTYLPE